MEEFLTIVSTLIPYGSYVLMGLGSLVVFGGMYIKFTPSKKDDAWWLSLENMPVLGVFLKALSAFSPFKRK